MERLSGAAELLDGPLDRPTLAGNLRDLARVNRLLGGADLSWRALLAAVGPGRIAPLTVLDVGTGAADIPLHLLERARAADFTLAITATDVRAEIVELARQRAGGAADGRAGLTIELAEPGLLAGAPRSFDIVHASLVLHHLEPDEAIRLLTQMGRLARRAVIINDLDRARRWWLAAWCLSRMFTGNRYTRHDAPLSVRRAYRPDELSALAAVAGLHEVGRLRDRHGHRYALILAA